MTDAPLTDPLGGRATDTCYRHPDRQSFVLCQRCGRTICPECQIQAPVGVHCPECAREGARSMRSGASRGPRVANRMRFLIRPENGQPVVTYAIIALNVLVFLVQLVSGGQNGAVTQALVYYPPLTIAEPWRLLTSMFAHANFLHILFNMYALYIFGTALEHLLGRWRYLALYLIGGLAGSAGVMLLAPSTPVLGASGAVFALFAAFFIVQRHLGGNAAQVLIIIVLNLALGFFVSGVAWQAHLGGAIAGALIALLLVSTRRRTQWPLQLLGLAGILLVVVAALLSRFFVSF